MPPPFAGDHQHDLGAVRLCPTQEPQQRGVRLALGPAVQVDAGVDLNGAAGEALFEPAIERDERRNRRRKFWRRRFRCSRSARRRWMNAFHWNGLAFRSPHLNGVGRQYPQSPLERRNGACHPAPEHVFVPRLERVQQKVDPVLRPNALCFFE